jgi:hypothetical protein
LHCPKKIEVSTDALEDRWAGKQEIAHSKYIVFLIKIVNACITTGGEDYPRPTAFRARTTSWASSGWS